MIAALFVQARGVYFGVPGVDPWDEARDARKYDGPWPVVAHPPCARWGRYWHGGPNVRVRRVRGDDGGCFASAISSVQKFGGILEHPEASAAWLAFRLAPPPRAGGWVPAGLWAPGWTCCVEQGCYGHRARKATWLYAVTERKPPDLVWGPSKASVRLDAGFHSAEARRAAGGHVAHQRMSGREVAATPVKFMEALLSIVELDGRPCVDVAEVATAQ